MKQRSLRSKKRHSQASEPKSLSDIGVDKVHYNPADDFFVVSQDNLSGTKPAVRRRKRRSGSKARGKGLLGCSLMLILAVCVGLPLAMTSSPSSDTSAVVVPESSTAAAEAAAAAQLAETARQDAEAKQLQAQQAAEAAAAAQQAEMARQGAAAKQLQAQQAAATEQMQHDEAALEETAAYENCAEVWDKLDRAILSTEAGYSRELDRDGDGTACESRPAR